jgi:AraC-like DNA-binding protein
VRWETLSKNRSEISFQAAHFRHLTQMPDDEESFHLSRISDPDLLVESVRGADLNACILSRGSATSELSRVLLPESCLDMVAIGPRMLFSGSMPRDYYTLVYIVECPTPGRAFNFMTDHVDGYMAVFTPGNVLDAMIPAGYRNGSLTIPTEDFHRYLEKYFPENRGELLKGAALRVGKPEQSRLRYLVDSARRLLADPDRPLADADVRVRLERMLRAAFFDGMRSGVEELISKPTVRVERRYVRLREVREYIAGHLDKPIHLDDLCLDSGLSRRGLENLFNDFLGTGVIAFLRHQRLHGARRALRDSVKTPGTVKRIAFDWSFWHMGHFSRDYRQVFGESPCQTLAKADN